MKDYQMLSICSVIAQSALYTTNDPSLPLIALVLLTSLGVVLTGLTDKD